MTRRKCSPEEIPMVRMALERKKCLRRKGPLTFSPDSTAAFIHKHYGCEPQEVFLAIALNPRSEILHVQEISLGGFDGTQVDPRVIFGGALLAGASAIILAHNHPSGDPIPSRVDLALTKQLVEGGRILSLRVLDHLVVGRGGAYVSMQAQGLMPIAASSLTGLGDEDPIHYGEDERANEHR